MSQIEKITEVILASIRFVASEQQNDGSFLDYSHRYGPVLGGGQNVKIYHVNFFTSLVLCCLHSLPAHLTPELESIEQKAVRYLLQQKSPDWSYNYWQRGSTESQDIPYPDDLEDTFCAIAAILKHNPRIIDGVAMAKIVKLLIAAEEKEGGPYRTWLVKNAVLPEAENNCDLAVNANVAYALSLKNIYVGGTGEFIESAIKAKNYRSKYYPSEYPVIYFISRFYEGPCRQEVIEYILSKKASRHSWGSLLENSLVVSALLNLGFSAEELIPVVEAMIFDYEEYGFRAEDFCYDPSVNKEKWVGSSAALVAAVFIEALYKFQDALNNTTASLNDDIGLGLENTHAKIMNLIQQRMFYLIGEMKNNALENLLLTEKNDKYRQIAGMPFIFKASLGTLAHGLREDFLLKLGMANFYGWISYTIYDDFFDLEGEPKNLPVANLCLRELVAIFYTIFENSLVKKMFLSFFNEVLDRIDQANAWEITYCHIDISAVELPDGLPNYTDAALLAEKSIGHSLGPAAILFALGYNESSLEMNCLMAFFSGYLAARQLNDDAHDWEDDLMRGQVNYVAVKVIKQWHSMHAAQTGGASAWENPVQTKVDLQAHIAELKEVFWKNVIVEIAREILSHIEKARHALEDIGIIVNSSYLERLLMPIEKSARKALLDNEDSKKFLEEFTK